MQKRKVSAIIFALAVCIDTIVLADSLDIKISHHVNTLRSQGIDSIIVHRYSLFNGRFEIPYDSQELRCEHEPTVAHIFWYENSRWNCVRMDNCEPFEKVENVSVPFEKIRIDNRVQFSKKSSHFSLYKLIILSSNNRDSVKISGDQLTADKTQAAKSIRMLNDIIKNLEARNQFRRISKATAIKDSVYCYSFVDTLTKKMVYKVVDKMPEPIGGYQELFNEIKKVKYPHHYHLEGKLIFGFIVERDGSLSGMRVIKPLESIDWAEKVFDAIDNVKWSPGVCDGKPVETIVMFPIIVHTK
jgi:hypothetical protein